MRDGSMSRAGYRGCSIASPETRNGVELIFACTMCHTDLAAQVRAGLLAGDLWREAAAILLPFLIVLSTALSIGGRSAQR